MIATFKGEMLFANVSSLLSSTAIRIGNQTSAVGTGYLRAVIHDRVELHDGH